MSSNVVKSRNPTVSALAIVLGMYQVIVFVTFYFILSIHSEAKADQIPAADLHVAREQIDAAQAKIDQLTRELEIEQVRRRQAEAMCRDATAKLCSRSQTLNSLREQNIELHSTLTDVTAERDELMGVMKELAFARAILANDLSANDSLVSEDTEERVDIEAKRTTRVEKRREVRFAEFVDILVYQQSEEEWEEVTSSCEFFDDDSDGDKSTDSNMSLCSDLDTVFDSAFPSMLSTDFSDMSVSFDFELDAFNILSSSSSFHHDDTAPS